MLVMKNTSRGETRIFPLKLPYSLHRRLKIAAVEKGCTLQEFLINLVATGLDRAAARQAGEKREE